MIRKLFTCLFVLAVCLATAGQAANIVWVDEGAADSFPTWQAQLFPQLQRVRGDRVAGRSYVGCAKPIDT